MYTKIIEIFTSFLETSKFVAVKLSDNYKCSVLLSTEKDAMEIGITTGQELFDILLKEWIIQFLINHGIDKPEDLKGKNKELYEEAFEYYIRSYQLVTHKKYEFHVSDSATIIKEIRISMKYTVEQLAENITDKREIMRIEFGQYSPSTRIITKLSEKLRIDLQDFLANLQNSKTLRAYKVKEMFNAEIIQSKLDFTRLSTIKNEMESMPEFKNGENLQYLYYLNAILAATRDKDYELSNTYCLQGIQISNPSFDLEHPDLIGSNNVTLTMCNCLGCNYIYMENIDMAIKIFNVIINYLDVKNIDISYTPMYPYTNFEIKLYPNTVYNISTIYYRQKDYDNALIYADKGLAFSQQQHNSLYFPLLLQQKFCVLCRLKKFAEADNVYQLCHLLAENAGDSHRIETLEADRKELFNI